MKKANIFYFTLTDEMLKEQKLNWFDRTRFDQIPFEKIKPSKKNNWINLADNDFEELLPLADKQVKLGKSKEAVFELYSNGVNTARDEWVYDIDKNNLIDKMAYFSKCYNQSSKSKKKNVSIKWSSSLESAFKRGDKSNFSSSNISLSLYRPFVKEFYYSEKIFSDRLTQNHYAIFGNNLNTKNLVIAYCGKNHSKPFHVLAMNKLFGFDTLEKTQCLPLYRYDQNGNRYDNITDWGKTQFTTHYKDNSITKEAIFHYTYAVLHNPAYRKKYELNLKREFPRLPFYEDFWKWADWGKQLMELHLEYETVEPFGLQRVDKKATKKAQSEMFKVEEPEPMFKAKGKVAVKLKADKESGIIEIDADTRLEGVPDIAWTYKLGNRSALEWILDQYKEKKPRDKTIAEKFNTYRFADYKEQVIDLLQRVCTVSVQTMKIIEGMKA